MTPAASEEALRRTLRRELRDRRRTITGMARNAAARRVAAHIERARLFTPGRRIGLYLAMPEELPTDLLLDNARRHGCTVSLPRILSPRRAQMRFFDAAGALRTGAYGIQEAGGTRLRRARELDIVFVPLVGFDARGFRIGMGKGFYDRQFAHRRQFRIWRRPLLIGVAYDVQEVPSLPVAAHDVPLDGIVTESALRWFGQGDPS